MFGEKSQNSQQSSLKLKKKSAQIWNPYNFRNFKLCLTKFKTNEILLLELATI